MTLNILLFITLIFFSGCQAETEKSANDGVAILDESKYITISRETYKDQLYGFWLGQSIANWTGLVTEMDKIGNIGEIKTGDFYTRAA